MAQLAEINRGWPNTCVELQTAMRRVPRTTAWVRLHRAAVACSSVSTPDWLLDMDLVRQAADQGPLIIDCSTDPFNGHERAVVDWLRPHYSKFIVLASDARYLEQPCDHICYFPYFFLCLEGHDMHDHAVVLNAKRQYPLSCVNGRARTHRIENWLKIRHRPWFARCLWRMNRRFDAETEQQENGLDFEDPAMLDQWLAIMSTMPEPHGIDHTANDPAHRDAYINLVPESHVRTGELFVSEKTFKPLISGQLGIWLAAAGTVGFLRRLGFDMFDDLIDHSYDLEPDWHRRIDMIHVALDKVIDRDWFETFERTADRRLANLRHINDTTLNNKLNEQCNYYSRMIE